MNKKPDALLLLAIVFGLGVLASALTHGGNDQRADQSHIAVTAGAQSVSARQ
jgi:hypothetical protein